MSTPRPYGSWKSPITSDLIVRETVSLSDLRLEDGTLTWIEGRPSEGGRRVVVRWTEDGPEDVTPPGFNVRTRVHEYGGGDHAVVDGAVLFANYEDQRLYRQDPGEAPRPLTPRGERRYADLAVDRPRDRLLCVLEDHGDPGEPENALASLPLEGGEAEVLVSGADFYAAPRPSPDGSRLAWLAWDHPRMPWDGTELWLAKVNSQGRPVQPTRVAGGPEEAVIQPIWSPDGTLHFVSDPTGWWNLYRHRGGRAEPLWPQEAECGVPPWLFGTSTYGFASDRRLVTAYSLTGVWHLASLDLERLEAEPVETPFTHVHRYLGVDGERVAFVGGSPTEPLSVVEVDLEGRATRVLRRSSTAVVDPNCLSAPEVLAFPTGAGDTAYGFLYRPAHSDHVGPEGTRPPLLVRIHGGPTSAAVPALDLAVQYWTSRGFAYLDLNYRGSTGYGRAYREALKGRWGTVDVEDAVQGARHLAEEGTVDGARLVIRGGSAGGYTTLAALAFHDVFDAGACYYGVSDLERLAQETHKFESRYLDGLVGPYPGRRDLYRARSPIHHAASMTAPLILFQGLEDPVVPPSQSEAIYEALRARGVPVAYVPFEGEQHGFRRAESQKRALDAELSFYAQVLGFDLPQPADPVPVENL